MTSACHRQLSRSSWASRRWLRAWVATGAIACTATAFAAPPAPADVKQAQASHPALRELLQRFRAMPGLSATFVEEKTMAILAMPLVSTGELHFSQVEGQRALVRHTYKPAPSSLLLINDTLRLGDSAKFQVIDLKSQPVVRLFVDSFVELFAGDEAALSRLYAVEFDGDLASWSLRLVPRSPAVAKVIARIELRGRDVAVDRIDMRETNGDLTTTQFSQVQLGRRFTDREKEQFFRLLSPASPRVSPGG